MGPLPPINQQSSCYFGPFSPYVAFLVRFLLFLSCRCIHLQQFYHTVPFFGEGVVRQAVLLHRGLGLPPGGCLFLSWNQVILLLGHNSFRPVHGSAGCGITLQFSGYSPVTLLLSILLPFPSFCACVFLDSHCLSCGTVQCNYTVRFRCECV